MQNAVLLFNCMSFTHSRRALRTPVYSNGPLIFVKMMRDVCMMEDEVLVSFDVVSLFTNVPIGEAVKVIQVTSSWVAERAARGETTTGDATICLRSERGHQV